jgi:hypothetical protein
MHMLSAKLFIEDRLEERSIELADGSVEVLHFRHLPNTAFERYAIWTNSADEDVVATAHARLLALGLCTADGKDAITAAQAERLKRPVMLRMIAALLEVNGFGKRTDGGSRDAEAGNV